jgi:hypothetical protein
MNCRDIRKIIDQHFGPGPQDPGGKTAMPAPVDTHIASCPDCAAYLNELALLGSMLNSADYSVRPGELDSITFDNIAAAESSRWARGRSTANQPNIRWLWAPVAVAAAIILVILIPKIGDTPSSLSTDSFSSSGITSAEIINDISSSDSLGDEVLSSLAADIDFENVADEIIYNAEIADLLQGLTPSELEALSDKIDELSKGATRKG